MRMRPTWLNLRTFTPVASVLGAVALWHLATVVIDIPRYILPSPVDVAQTLREDWPIFRANAVTTLQESIQGLLMGVTAAVVLALVMVRVRVVYAVLMPLITMQQSIPMLAFAPLFVIWFGFGQISKVLISALIAFFPVLVTTIRSLTSVDRRLLTLLRSLAAGSRLEYTLVRIPHSLPSLFAAIRIAIPLSIVGAVVGEFVQADSGLGYMILLSTTNVDTAGVFGCVVLLAAISATYYLVVTLIENALLKRRFGHMEPVAAA